MTLSFQDMDRLGVGCHWGERWGKDGPTSHSRETQDLLRAREQVHYQVLHSAVFCSLLLPYLHRLHPGQVGATGSHMPPSNLFLPTLKMGTHVLFNF